MSLNEYRSSSYAPPSEQAIRQEAESRVAHRPKYVCRHDRSQRGDALTKLDISAKVDPPIEAHSVMSAHAHYGLTVAVRSVRPIRVRIVCATRRKPSAPLGIYPQVPLYGQIGSTPRHNTPNTTITIVLILILLLFAHSPHTRSFCGHTRHSHTFCSPDGGLLSRNEGRLGT